MNIYGNGFSGLHPKDQMFSVFVFVFGDIGVFDVFDAR